MEEIKLLPEEWSVFTDYYEYDPRLYSLEQIDCAELTANNCLEQFREDMEEFIRQVNREWGEKLRATDTDHIFNIICHGIWDRITEVQRYYFNECDKTRTKILEMMEEEQSGARQTPCDIPEIGCPYNAQGGDDCRRYCGLGVDE